MTSQILLEDILTRVKVKLAGSGVIGAFNVYEDVANGDLEVRFEGLPGGDSIDWLNREPEVLLDVLNTVTANARRCLQWGLSCGDLFFEVGASDRTLRRVPCHYWQTPAAEETLQDGLMHTAGISKYIRGAEEIDGLPVFCDPDRLEAWLKSKIGGYSHVLVPRDANSQPRGTPPNRAIELFPGRAGPRSSEEKELGGNWKASDRNGPSIAEVFEQMVDAGQVRFDRGGQVDVADAISKITGHKPNTVAREIRARYNELKAKHKA